jgi:hypothetical protein
MPSGVVKLDELCEEEPAEQAAISAGTVKTTWK